MLFTRKRTNNQIRVMIRGFTISSKYSIKYLGFYLDRKLRFVEHARMVADKADEATRKLARILPNTGGAKFYKRKLLATVTQSILMYGAPAWAKEMGKEGWSILDRSNRKIGLRVITAYRTVSKEAVEVISGMPPSELIAQYRRSMQLAEERQDAEEKLLRSWQSRWETSEKGRWTHKLIPDIKKWYKRKHGMVDFHITQVLTGHGCFAAYLKRFGKTDSEECWFCRHSTDDASHTLFECDAWAERRRRCCMLVREEIHPENLVTIMLSEKENWEAVSRYINSVMSAKEEEERKREREPII